MKRVRDAMSRQPFTVAAGTHAGEADRLAEKRGVCHVPVVDRGRLVGVTCRCRLRQHPAELEVDTLVDRPLVAIRTSGSLTSAARVMRAFNVDCLPVISRGDLVGILTRSDLREAGEPIEPDQLTCPSCGSRQHLRADPRAGGVAFCLECAEVSRNGSEMGGGD